MKPLMEILKKTLSINSRDYEFIKGIIERRSAETTPEAVDFSTMMCFLFSWSETPQGHAYWDSVIKREMQMQEDLLNHSHE